MPASSPCRMVEDKQSVLLRNNLIPGENELHAEEQLEQGDVERLPGGVEGVRALSEPPPVTEIERMKYSRASLNLLIRRSGRRGA